MSIQSIAQNLVFGLLVGGIYGLAAVGLALVFGVMKVLNIAHGELLMIGGYVTYWCFSLLNIDPFVSLLASVAILFVLGLLLERGVFRYVARLAGETRLKNSLLVSFGFTLILQNLAIRLFSADDRTVEVAYVSGHLSVLGVVLPYTRLLTLLIALLIILALHYYLHHTLQGKAILGTAEDWEAAELAGINVPRVYMQTFALSAALAGVAGSLVSVSYGISPDIGLSWTLKALVVVVLAGTGSIFGAFPAGLLLGLVEALSATFFGASYREVVGLMIFLLVLLLRPQGLFGRT